VIVAKHKKQFLSLCRTQISLEMTAPTSEGVSGGWGSKIGAGLSVQVRTGPEFTKHQSSTI
jgi:hypothetical protein